MKALGFQHVVEFVNCNNNSLNNCSYLEQILVESIETAGLKSVKVVSHSFEPVGVTVLAIISESHIGLHTYPEAGQVSLDVYTCSGSGKQFNFIKLMEEKLKPEVVRIAEIVRGNPIEIKNKGWITSASTYGFEVRYTATKTILSTKSGYQNIDIIENEHFGKMLFLDKDLQLSTSDESIYSDTLTEPVSCSAENVLVLGGGDGGVLKSLLRKNIGNVTLVDIDRDVIRYSQEYLPEVSNGAFKDCRVKIINEDAYNYLDFCGKYDAVIYDLTMQPEAYTTISRKDYINGIIKKISLALNNNGVLSLQCCSEYDNATLNLLSVILHDEFKEVNFSKRFIPSFCENWIFATAVTKK